ncbi:DUF998 domain-containing protein [Novipirellula artificiosorum]|uniref:Uncharacterized protein n=1 Tax=Novipirellula artificiosorum TaxID=2528016 RepID=A0A5C6D9V6_9BACT|nr:hypothetical protein [Novipirellula artificiosorum]TWU32016.1 hypothetical protein Poly41_59040 [Novipirellula artificiosorum]
MVRPSSLQIDKLLIAGVFLAALGLTQFLIFVTSAMNHYPGGTSADTQTIGYSWSDNWLSDLGRIKAINGADNATSSRFFNASIIALGLSLLAFFLVSIRAFEEQTIGSLSTTLSGSLTSLGLIGIGLTPVDVCYGWHMTSLMLWIVPMLCVGVLFSYQCFSGEGWFGWVIGIATAILFCGVFVYALSTATTGVMAMQKIVVLQSIVWFTLLSARVAAAALYVVQQTRTRMQIANEQAGDYMVKLQRQHRKK